MPTSSSSRTAVRPLPSQGQLLLPLLDTLHANGGALPAKSACDALAERVALTPDERAVSVALATGDVNRWDRHVRFVRQRAVQLGFITGETRNLWQMTPAGRNGLRDATPEIVVTVVESPTGVALWATAESAARVIADGTVTTILTSPPFPILTLKPYQTSVSTDEYVEWLLSLAAEWKRLLSADGTMILNLGQVYEPGQPTVSLYREELYLALRKKLGYFLAMDGYWHNRSKMPGPAAHVTVNRLRLTGSVEHVYAFSKSPHPKWDNRRALVPYSEAMKQRLAQGGEREATRPSGHHLARGSFGVDCGGAIAKHLFDIPHSGSRSAYLDYCKAQGLPVHPARFPEALVEQLVKLTTEEGDLVYDPFGGSLTTAAVCERLNRRWITSERSLTYLAGGASRLGDGAGALRDLAGAAT